MARRSRLKTKSNRRRRTRILLIFLLLFTTVAGAGLLYREQLVNLMDIWRESFPLDSPAGDTVRGTIYDRNFKELARTLERVSLYVRPREVENIPEMATILSEILGLPENEVIARLSRDSHLVWLRHDIAQEDEETIVGLNLPGIYFHREFARTYPMQEHASHLIGYSENDQGLTGVEHHYNRLLNQNRVRQKDIPTLDLKGLQQTSANGHDLVLTLDMKIQAILEKHVTEIGEKMGRGRIASLLIDTAEGEIIGGANYPSYNSNSLWQHEKKVLNSLLYLPMVIPEEIRRLFLDASLLQGGWEQGTQVFPWSVAAPDVNFSRQLRLWERLQLSTGIDVDFSDTRKQDTALPQFVDCSSAGNFGTVPKTGVPLKVLEAVTHLVNGGMKIKPHILDRILERPDQKEYYYDAYYGERKRRNVLPSLLSREMRTLIQAQGVPAILGSTTLAGESVSLVRDFSGGRHVRDRMSLTLIPAEKPELILLIVSRREEIGPESADCAGAESLDKNLDAIIPPIMALQQVSFNFADIVEAEESEERNFKGWRNSEEGQPETLEKIFDEQVQFMPDLVGFSLRKGLRVLQRNKADIEVRGSGRIVSHMPKAGVELKKSERVVLILKKDAIPKEGTEVRPVEKAISFD